MELEPQVLGYKGEWCVFGGSDLVARKRVQRVTVFVKEICGKRLIEKQCSTCLVVVRTGVGTMLAVLGVAILVVVVVVGLMIPRDRELFRRNPFVPIKQRQPLSLTALDSHLARGPSSSLCLDLVEVLAVARVLGGIGGGHFGARRIRDESIKFDSTTAGKSPLNPPFRDPGFAEGRGYWRKKKQKSNRKIPSRKLEKRYRPGGAF